MHRAEYVPARKGGRHFRDHLGMLYYLSKRRENKSYYFCTEKKRIWAAELLLLLIIPPNWIKNSGDHAHDSNIRQRNVRNLEGPNRLEDQPIRHEP